MNRLEKSAEIEALKEKINRAKATFLTEYRGMSVQSLYELRKKIKEGQGELRVAKNRLVKVALKGSPFELIASELTGPIAIAFSYNDPVPVAKALIDSRSDNSPFKIKVGSLGSKKVVEKEIESLSKLPSREILLATLLGTLKAPMQNLVGVLAAVPRDYLNVLNAVKAEKEKSK